MARAREMALAEPGTADTEGSRDYWLMAAMALILLVPIQFEIGSLLMTPLRILLLLSTPILLLRFARGDFGKAVVTDYAIFFFCFWMTLSVFMFNPSIVVTFAGSNVLLVLGGYMVGRAAIRTSHDFRRLSRLMAWIIVLLLPLGYYEAITHQPSPVLDFLSSIPFIDSYADSPYCCRLGMSRAQTVFIHPIHFGVYCAMGFGIYFLSNTNHISFPTRLLVGTLMLATCISSVSSGPLIVIAFQFGMIIYALAFHRMPAQWTLMLVGAFFVWVLLEVNTTKLAFFRLAELMAFSAHNAHTRQIMIDVGVDLLRQYPIFGFGIRPWPLPFWMHSDSIDNYWLLLGGAYGAPVLGSVLFAIFWSVGRVGRKKRFTKGSDLYWTRLSWSFLMIGLVIALATVAMWGAMTAMVYAMLGAGMFLHTATEPEKDKAPDTTPEPVTRDQMRRRKAPLPYTRFPDGPRRGQRPSPAERTAPQGRRGVS